MVKGYKAETVGLCISSIGIHPKNKGSFNSATSLQPAYWVSKEKKLTCHFSNAACLLILKGADFAFLKLSNVASLLGHIL